MGSVYRAYDRLTGQTVALKRVRLDGGDGETEHTTSVDSRLVLAGEFRLLASLRHPNVIAVLDYGFDDDGLPFYTMDLLENAQTIIKAAAATTSQDAQIGLLIQLLQALAYMHQRGIIHRDLKPQNVLVTGHTVHVLDFGLSTLIEQAIPGGTTGTLAYMAPEVLRGGAVTTSADLYAVGVIAYEMLTGHHPFVGPDTNTTLRNILTVMPNLVDVGLDFRVAAILDRLLSKDPADRHPSATALINSLNQVLQTPVALETAATRESFLQAARFVGRDVEVRQLTQALDETINRAGAAWLIGGESGVGKSRLIDEIATLAMVRGAIVLRGQAVESGSSPFHMWRAPLRWLGLLSDIDETDAAILGRLLPEVAAARRLDPADSPSGSSRQLPRVIERLLAAQNQPIVLIFEDLQWAGSESLALLDAVSRIARDQCLLIIASYRDDERADIPSTLSNMHLLRLARLTPDSIADLSEAMLGESGRAPAIVTLLSQETEGNVFFLIEIVRALAEEAGQLDRVSNMALPDHVFTGGVDRIVQRRLQAVPSDVRALLKIAAIVGRELDPALLYALIPEQQPDYWLSICVDAAVIEYRDGQWRFAHDKLRHGLLQGIGPDERRSLHRRVAIQLEALYPGDSGHYAALAYHWSEADEPAKEAKYAGLAGQEALRSSAYREAIQFASRALALRVEHAVANAHLYQVLGDAQAAIGQYEEAVEAFQCALADIADGESSTLKVDVLYGLGDVMYALEHFEDAEQYYRLSMECSEQLEDAKRVMRALSSLGNVAYDLDDYDKANEYYKQSLALSREHGNRWGMAGSFGAAGEENTGS